MRYWLCKKCDDEVKKWPQMYNTPQCCGETMTEYTEATNPPVPQVCLKDLLKTKKWLNNEFRMIISHRLLGYDCDIEVVDWEGMLDSLVDAACEKLGGF
jgi:hypothetical protein